MRNPTAVVFTTAILVCTLFVPSLFAGQKGCTMANVAGTYGYEGFGTVLAGNPARLPAGTYSSMGTLSFDGKGNLLIIDTERIDDFFAPPDTQYPSTYTGTSPVRARRNHPHREVSMSGAPGPGFGV